MQAYDTTTDMFLDPEPFELDKMNKYLSEGKSVEVFNGTPEKIMERRLKAVVHNSISKRINKKKYRKEINRRRKQARCVR